MSERAIQIIEIEKTSPKKTTYKLNTEQFQCIIDRIRDKEVAVISIAGPSRMGKSFLLSYFLKYLELFSCDTGDNDDSQELEGFDWKRGINPTTQGVWMWSKPFLFQDKNKNTIAVLLMDTQGVYDEFTDLRDWSTIFGISLLTSSCFIYNEFNQLNENMFINFESYLNYGLLATGSENTNEPPFQKLLFLIRDWQNAADFAYGERGGTLFLREKLQIKENQSEAAQRSRKLIKECFKEVSSFLMPDPGPNAKENRNFNGSVEHLNENFVQKMKELFSTLLNPEMLNVKTICGKSITSGELLEYFHAYVEKFNSDELPKPSDLVEATAKATDLIYVLKIKDIYLTDMKSELELKPFLTEQELSDLNINKSKQIIKSFEKTKKSSNQEIISELLELISKELTSGFEQISAENNKKRDEFLNTLIENCAEFYTNSINESLKSSFVTPEIFDELSATVRVLTQKMFSDGCGKEIDSIESYFKKISDIIEQQEISFKLEIQSLFNEAFTGNTDAVNSAFDRYSTQMNSLLTENYYFKQRKFEKNEQNIRDETMNFFSDKCSYGDENFIKQFSDQLSNRIDEAFQQFLIFNQTNVENLVANTEQCLSDSIKFYTENISDIESISSKSELENKHKELSEKAILMLDKFDVSSNSNFVIPYKARLNEEIERIFNETENLFVEKVNNFKSFCENKVEEIFDLSVNEIKSLFDEHVLNENDELRAIKSNILNEVMLRFESAPKVDAYVDIENYIFKGITNECDLLLMNKLMNQYVNDMNIQLSGELYFTRRELHNIYIENKLKVIDLFNDNIKAKDVNFIQGLNKSLKTNLETIYKKLYEENEKRRDEAINDAIVKCKNDYCDTMQIRITDANNYLSFHELSEQVKQDLLKDLIAICGKEKELCNQYCDNYIEIPSENWIIFRDCTQSHHQIQVYKSVHK